MVNALACYVSTEGSPCFERGPCEHARLWGTIYMSASAHISILLPRKDKARIYMLNLPSLVPIIKRTPIQQTLLMFALRLS